MLQQREKISWVFGRQVDDLSSYTGIIGKNIIISSVRKVLIHFIPMNRFNRTRDFTQAHVWLWEIARTNRRILPRKYAFVISIECTTGLRCINKAVISCLLTLRSTNVSAFNCSRFRVYFQLVICKCCRAIGRTNARSREMQELTGFQRSVACNSGEYSSFLLESQDDVGLVTCFIAFSFRDRAQLTPAGHPANLFHVYSTIGTRYLWRVCVLRLPSFETGAPVQ